MGELERLIDDNTIMCLTETQLKIDRIKNTGNLMYVDSMREMQDKKGGGLRILWRKEKEVDVEEIETKIRDILCVKCRVSRLCFYMVLVYFPCDNKEEDKKRRREMEKEVENIIEEKQNYPVMILGDFNGHVGFLGKQKLDEGGSTVLNLMNKYNLIMLNNDEKCKGLYTWEGRGQKSVIDYALVNTRLYDEYKNMTIDEGKDIMDITDHNLMEIKLKKPPRMKKITNKTKEIVYFKKDESSLQVFTQDVEEELNQEETMDIEKLEEIMKRTADKRLKRVYRKRSTRDGNVSPWMTEEIKKEIATRKEYNRKKRNALTDQDREKWEKEYKKQKRNVQDKIRREIYLHEEKITKEIKQGKDQGKKLWDNIKKLRGQEIKKKDSVQLYKDGKRLQEEEKEEEMMKFWKGIYQKEANNIPNVWNEDKRKKYENSLKEENKITLNGQDRMEVPMLLREHMDAVGRVETFCNKMEHQEISTTEIKNSLKSMKAGKAAGPDNLKPEYFKAFQGNDKCLEALKISLNKILESGEIPESWTESNTIMIPKVKTPEAKDLRPISLTNMSYKIFMRIMRERIDTHLKMNEEEKEEQSGFTTGKRIEDNLYLLQYCIRQTYEQRKQLYIAAVDFKKAFDYVSREKLIEVMIEYKVNSKIIQCIKEIYSKDKTRIKLDSEREIKLNITNGIRQGCTGSTTLFKLITYIILDKLQKNGCGYVDHQVKINTLFFADDGLQMSSSKEEAVKNIKDLIEISKSCGLELNKEKSCFILYNVNEKIEAIEGIKVTDKIKYLGVHINNQKNCFREHKEEMLKKAQSMANLTYSVVSKSCNKMLIGKTYWKSVVMPMLLHGSSVIDYKKEELRKLQSIENGVFRMILGARKYTAEEGVRGEAGASLFQTRIMKSKLTYIQSILKGGRNELVEQIIRNSIVCRADTWSEDSMKILDTLGVSVRRLKEMTRSEIEKSLLEWDTIKWKEGMAQKSSLEIYRQNKEKVGQVDYMYDNRPNSIIFFQARTNSLPLHNRVKFLREDSICPVCGNENENLEHFILFCAGYREERKKILGLQQPYQENKEQIIGKILFEFNNRSEVELIKEVLYNFWKIRNKELEKSV